MAAVAALRIGTDGAVSDVQLGAGSRRQLHDLYREIGCDMVECVTLTESLEMWLDEEGIEREQDVNPYATTLAALFGYTDQPYFGPVVLTGGAGRDNGEMLPLAAEDAAGIRSMLALMGRAE